MATSSYCKISMEEWKECSAEPDGSSHLNDKRYKRCLCVYGADFLLLYVHSVCIVWGCEGELGRRSRGWWWGMGKKEGTGQILTCRALMKSYKGLQQLWTSAADSLAETCKSGFRLGGKKRELCDKSVFLEWKGIRALKTLCVRTWLCGRERRKEGTSRY